MSAYAAGVGPRSLAIQTFWYFIGSVVLHSGGCINDDIWDRDLDKQVGVSRAIPACRLRV